VTIPTSSPVSVLAVTNNAGSAQFQTSPAHGLANLQIATVAGCRNVSGALVAGYNGAATVTVIDAYNFTISAAYVGGAPGYSFGGGVWATGAELTSAELTEFDSKLALRATDKTGDALSGQYTLSGTPGILISDPTAQVVTNSPGSQIVTSGAGVKYLLGDGDDVVLDPPRPRSIFISMTEALNEYGSDAIQFGQQLAPVMTVQSNNTSSTPTVFWLPLSRLHDGAILVAATLYFFPSPGFPDLPPTVMPTLQLFRMDPSADVALTSLAANGPAVFPFPASPKSYAETPPVPASGFVTPSFLLIGETVQIAAGQLLGDAAGNTFKVKVSGNYTASTPVPIVAVAPATGTFFAANGNDAGGTVLTWASAPSGLGPTATVTAAGLSGGLNSFYAQKLVFTPDSSLSVINQNTYVYVAKVTDDDITNANGGVAVNTAYAGIRLDFAGITSLAPQ
jgi:hypothetical protein